MAQGMVYLQNHFNIGCKIIFIVVLSNYKINPAHNKNREETKMADKHLLYSLMMNELKKMQDNPATITDADRDSLHKILHEMSKATGISEHIKWEINYAVEKWHSMNDKLSGIAPYEVVNVGQNVVLDTGANEILKLIVGDSTATAFNNANSRIYVGTDSTPENASQTSIIATGSNRAVAIMDSAYPTVSGRTVVYRATFGDDAANFNWNEICVTNGTGANAITMNRKVADMGTKNGGTWTAQITISLVST